MPPLVREELAVKVVEIPVVGLNVPALLSILQLGLLEGQVARTPFSKHASESVVLSPS